MNMYRPARTHCTRRDVDHRDACYDQVGVRPTVATPEESDEQQEAAAT